VVKSGMDFYTPTGSGVTSIPSNPSFPLTNGARIIGLLSMPKTMPEFVEVPPATGFQSNYVIAYVRAFSGTVVNKAPQTNSIILSDAFIYRMIVENFPYAPVDTNAFCLNCPATIGLTPAQMLDRTNLSRTVWMLQTNAHDFRLRFRWPVLPNGQIPNYGLATFRAMASGELLLTNDPLSAGAGQPMYFVQSSTYAQGTTNPP
jgi:hypothetical protein